MKRPTKPETQFTNLHHNYNAKEPNEEKKLSIKNQRMHINNWLFLIIFIQRTQGYYIHCSQCLTYRRDRFLQGLKTV